MARRKIRDYQTRCSKIYQVLFAKCWHKWVWNFIGRCFNNIQATVQTCSSWNRPTIQFARVAAAGLRSNAPTTRSGTSVFFCFFNQLDSLLLNFGLLSWDTASAHSPYILSVDYCIYVHNACCGKRTSSIGLVLTRLEGLALEFPASIVSRHWVTHKII